MTTGLRRFDVTPEAASVPVGGRVNYAVTWTVPEGEVWRNFNTIDFRLQKGSHTAMWFRWDETADTFSLCENNGQHGRGHGDDDNVVCGQDYHRAIPTSWKLSSRGCIWLTAAWSGAVPQAAA